MMIPEHKVEEVRAASDIVDVVSDYVRLKKKGANYFGLCPFHNEKSPSFSVNPNMGIFKCFGCNAGGDVFGFVKRIEGTGFVETVQMLADKAGIALPKQDDDRERSTEIDAIYHALRFAARYYYRQLTQTDAGKPALDYLTGRGFTAASIKQFGLGYAPDSWDALLKEAEQEFVDAETLEKAGLVLPRKQGDGHYDRFRGRVLFPIFSHVGKVLGFGGRILTKDTDQPKYINSPETKVYSKSRVLYGLYQGKQAIRKTEEVLLVEGYTDVMALHQAGVANVVASSGTALTAGQVKMLSRYAKRVLLLYDADAAGAEAALRGIDLVLAQGLSAYAIALPGGEDPDSYVRTHGGEAFQEYAQKNRQDFAAFTYQLARRSGQLDTPEGEAEVMHTIVASIAKMPDSLTRETFLRRASEVLGIPDIRLYEALGTARRDENQKERRRAARPPILDIPLPDEEPLDPEDDYDLPVQEVFTDPLPEEKILLQLMLEKGLSMVEYVLGHMGLDEFSEGPSRRIAEELISMYQEDRIQVNRFFDGEFGEAVQSLAAEVLATRHEPSENWQTKQISVPRFNADPHESAASAMTLLKLDRVRDAIDTHKQKLYRAAQHNENLRPLQEQMMQLHALRKHIEQRDFLQA